MLSVLFLSFVPFVVLVPFVLLLPLVEPLVEPVLLAPLVVRVPEDCVEDVPWFVVALGFTLLDCWFALVPLVTLWLPLPTFTPGLTFALALRSELLMLALAFKSTFGFTLIDRLEVPFALPVDPFVALPAEPFMLLVEPLVLPALPRCAEPL